MKKLIIHSDGGARGNPGPAAIGVVIETDDKEVLEEISEYIGESTNNIAEYTAVLRGLQVLKARYGKETTDLEIDWKLDSELVVKQLAGEYKVKNPGLRSIFLEIQDLRAHFPKLSLSHVRREENKEADRLVNEALDKEAKK
ncbi:ribonuclease H [Candidatus Kaiserbacteria bacterium CG10_big_fil_rev_8_21_14_0_10_44_10]|uniref:Ribonuclease H n=1 Tax=Candidatus Kaiserbacteria bacterium CG10_big_fil_rev_8_21_14_0_10_44_10 TaxID=1974606 RepID=A0A2H0UIR8_9BACT|nr:MAG: ribonuclease H [Candidatus Kaiserbacteria bacterium CG10_big_fil_rev_8_21_14_0_10_44_10]